MPSYPHYDAASEAEHVVSELRRQIAVLQTSLLVNEASWASCGFANIVNPVGAGIRKDIFTKDLALVTALEAAEKLRFLLGSTSTELPIKM